MCFTLAWLEQMLVWFVVIVAVLALLRLIVSAIAGVPFWPLAPWPPTAPGTAPISGIVGFVIAAVNIVIWAFIAIALIYFVFMMIGCLLSFTGGFPPLLPHR